jgi:hypothetical protein
MPQSVKERKSSQGSSRTSSKGNTPLGSSRYTVGLAPKLALQVEKYAKANDSSMSKAIASLVRIGLEGQEHRKREFFKKLKANLADADPGREDELVDEFRSLILGH